MKNPNAKKFTRGHEALLKFLRGLITSTNVWLLKVSKGKIGNSFLGVPVLLMTTIGRKSGEPRTLPLYYMEDGQKIILVASNAGTPTDPAWLMNIRANPAVTVKVGGQERQMWAHLATPVEKGRLWPRLTTMFPKWQMMEDRSRRSFPVVVLEPVFKGS